MYQRHLRTVTWPAHARFVAHLCDDDERWRTTCGKPWQSWQAPKDLDPRAAVTDVGNPRDHKDVIRLCGACLRAARRIREDARSDA